MEKPKPDAFVLTVALNDVAEIAADLVKRYPLNTYNERTQRADAFRRLRAAIELAPIERAL